MAKNFKQLISKSFQCIQGLWQNVISFTVLDTITAAINIIVVTSCFFFILFIMKILPIKSNLQAAYIKQSCVIIVIIYMLTIMITSLWRHISYIRHSFTKQSDSEPGPEALAEEVKSRE